MRLHASKTVAFLLTLGLCLANRSANSLAQEATPTPVPATSDQGNQMCAVAGTVTSLATGEPLKNARILLSAERTSAGRTPGHPPPRLVITDAAGHFSIDQVRPGRYSLVAYREGYMSLQYGQNDPEEDGAVLSLAQGQKINDLLFRMQRYAVITGRVVDEDGEPMPRVHIDALRSVRAHGSTKLELSDVAQTDDQGIYRIFDLAPGRYAVRANLTEGYGLYFGNEEPAQMDGKDPRSYYQPTYFPGTTDAARAAILDVKSGDEVPRVDFSFSPSAPSKTYRIRGRVTDSISTDSGPIMVVAVPHNSDSDTMETPDVHLAARADAKTGAFAIDQVPPGTYTVVAETIAGNKSRTARQDVSVTNTDTDGLLLALTRGIDISGVVRFEGSGASAAEKVQVLIHSKDQEFLWAWASQSESPVQKGGTFILTDVADGEYTVRVVSDCMVCYTKAATAGGSNLLETGLVISSGEAPAPLELLYSSDTGNVAGSVTRADDLPAPAAHVLLVRDGASESELERDAKSAATDQNGRFAFVGVPPGHYKALAFAKANADSLDDPDFVMPFAAKADSFGVSPGGTVTLQLKALAGTQIDSAN